MEIRREFPQTELVSFAAEDCHTCASLAASCDRRRPFCMTCFIGGRDCGGYKQASSRDVKGNALATTRETTDRTGKQHDFKFVPGRPKKSRPSRNRKAGQYRGFSHQFRVDSQSSTSTSIPQSTSNIIRTSRPMSKHLTDRSNIFSNRSKAGSR